MRMVQAGDGARLALEALAAIRVSRRMGRDDLHGDRAIRAGVGRSIHLPHATGADFLDDAIVPEGLADHVRMAGILRRGLQRVNVPVSLTVQAGVGAL